MQGARFSPAANFLLLGIDLGTSSLKAVIITSDGRPVALAGQEYPIDTPRPGWAEQDPEGWVAAAVASVRASLAQGGITPERIAGIGLSGQMHGTVCLDPAGRPLRPAVIWADQRSHRQVAEIVDELGLESLRQLTANPLHVGFMLATWQWLRHHEPETCRRTAHLLLPKDYLRLRLTGRLGSEPSDACSTLLFDTANRCWSGPLLDVLGIDRGLLPPLGQSTQVAGRLSGEMAVAMGLVAGTPVAFGGGDQACQALGNGILEPGSLSCTIGTGGQLLAPTHHPAADPQLRLHFFCHVLPDRWYQMAAILAAGLSLRWLRDLMRPEQSYAGLAEQAARVPPGAEGLIFLPHLVGERAPGDGPRLRASFVGLTVRHGRAHLARAVMEGVVLAMRHGLELMTGLGVPVHRVIASGGAAQHPLWLQLQADIFGRPVQVTGTREAAATGAALLAGVASGIYPDLESAYRRTSRPPQDMAEPDLAGQARYEEIYQKYRRLDKSMGGW